MEALFHQAATRTAPPESHAAASNHRAVEVAAGISTVSPLRRFVEKLQLPLRESQVKCSTGNYPTTAILHTVA
jgi:hypothetical protein